MQNPVHSGKPLLLSVADTRSSSGHLTIRTKELGHNGGAALEGDGSLGALRSSVRLQNNMRTASSASNYFPPAPLCQHFNVRTIIGWETSGFLCTTATQRSRMARSAAHPPPQRTHRPTPTRPHPAAPPTFRHHPTVGGGGWREKSELNSQHHPCRREPIP